jgi:hypothetical protein
MALATSPTTDFKPNGLTNNRITYDHFTSKPTITSNCFEIAWCDHSADSERSVTIVDLRFTVSLCE